MAISLSLQCAVNWCHGVLLVHVVTYLLFDLWMQCVYHPTSFELDQLTFGLGYVSIDPISTPLNTVVKWLPLLRALVVRWRKHQLIYSPVLTMQLLHLTSSRLHLFVVMLLFFLVTCLV